jgi:hypothetical protein
MATRTARLPVFVVSLATLGFGLFANTNIQAAGDTVWVTMGTSIAKYNPDGTAITNFITEPLPGQGTLAGAYLGGILVSGDILYVATMQGIVDAYTLLHHPISGLNSDRYVIATYNAETGNVVNFGFFRYPYLGLFVPRGMALSGTNLYVATAYQFGADQVGSISKIVTTTGAGNPSFINPIVTHWPAPPPTSGLVKGAYALAVNRNVLYVTNNYQNSNGDFYISTYTADTGALINANFIQIPTGGLYGLALKNISANPPCADLPFNTLYVSVYSGNAPGVYTYNACTGQLIKGPFVSVNEPYGIAIGGNTLYVASYQDSAIYEFDATTGQLTGSIKLSGAPTNIGYEPVGSTSAQHDGGSLWAGCHVNTLVAADSVSSRVSRFRYRSAPASSSSNPA